MSEEDDYKDFEGHPHDSLFKRVFGEQPMNAIEHLRHYLPEDLVGVLDVEELERVPGSFVDEALKQRHSDLLYAVPLRADPEEKVLVYVLHEHQRTCDRLMALRLLNYMTRIWDAWAQSKEKDAQLPPIFPLVLYHGQQAWTAPLTLGGLLGGTDEIKVILANFLPDFRYRLLDLKLLPELEIKGTASGRAALLVFKYIDEPDVDFILNKVASILDVLLQKHGLSGIEQFVYYLWHAHRYSTAEELVMSIRKNLGPEAEDASKSVAARLKEEGREEGGREQLLELATSVLGAESPAVDELRSIENLEVLRKRLAELLKAH